MRASSSSASIFPNSLFFPARGQKLLWDYHTNETAQSSIIPLILDELCSVLHREPASVPHLHVWLLRNVYALFLRSLLLKTRGEDSIKAFTSSWMKRFLVRILTLVGIFLWMRTDGMASLLKKLLWMLFFPNLKCDGKTLLCRKLLNEWRVWPTEHVAQWKNKN